MYIDGDKVVEQTVHYPSISDHMVDNYVGENYFGRMAQVGP